MGYKFEKYSIGGGGSGVGEYINMECYVKSSEGVTGDYYTLAQLFMSAGYSPAITYYVVDALPENPNVTDLTTANPTHIYFYNDIPYVYGNAGYGNMWLGVTDVLASSDIVTTAKGFTYSIELETERGVYVTYDQISQEGVDGLRGEIENLNTKIETLTDESKNIVEEFSLVVANGGHSRTEVDFSGYPFYSVGCFAFNDSIETVKLSEQTRKINAYCFYDCIALKSVTVGYNGALSIGSSAFRNCSNLVTIDRPVALTTADYAFQSCFSLDEIKVSELTTYIPVGVFSDCRSLASIIFGGTKERWKTLSKGAKWDEGTPDYIITCTDGTIAKDGTET